MLPASLLPAALPLGQDPTLQLWPGTANSKSKAMFSLQVHSILGLFTECDCEGANSDGRFCKVDIWPLELD